MGHSLDARGKPTFTPTPTQTVADLQAGADFTEEIGGLIKVTSSERGSLTSADTSVGWLISETDTGRLYMRTAASPQGELIYIPTELESVSFVGIYGSSTASPVRLRVRSGQAFLEGIATSSNIGFTMGTNYTLGSIPEEFAPAEDQRYPVAAGPTNSAFLVVRSDGVLIFSVLANFTGVLAMGLAHVNWWVG